VSALPLAVKVGSLIEKETKLLKIPNLKHQITNKSQISIFNDRNRFGILVIGDVFHIRVVAGHEKKQWFVFFRGFNGYHHQPLL